MENQKYIKDWNELKEVTSLTHTIEIGDCCGWIHAKDGSDRYGHYLSTHTFYGDFNKDYTKLLQSCGFDVVLANWDEIGY